MANISIANINKLVKIYEAVSGMASEQCDPFDHFYKGGTDKFFADFESVLKACGVKFPDNNGYYIVSYMGKTGKFYKERGIKPRKEWGICTDISCPDKSWCLTGFETPDEAEKVLRNPAVFDDVTPDMKFRILDAVEDGIKFAS